MSCPRRFDVGVYVLGALAPGERASFDEHLRTCADCSAELRELQGLPGLLSRVHEPEDGAPAPEAPPPGLLDRVEARARRARRARVLLAAASAVVVLGIGVLVGRALPGSTPEAARTVELVAVQSAPVRGEAQLDARPWGTAIVLRCRTSGTGPPGPVPDTRPVYVLTVTGPDGTARPVARWSPPPGADVDVQTAVDLPPDQVSGLQVSTGTGEVVLRG